MSKIQRIATTRNGTTLPTGLKGFFLWLQSHNPRLYAVAMPGIRSPSLSGLGLTADAAQIPVAAQETGAVKPSITDRIREILAVAAQTYLTAQQVKAQQKVLDMQLQRAQSGLPPLDIDMAAYGAVPSAQVGLSADTRSLLMWGAAALAAVYLVPKFFKR